MLRRFFIDLSIKWKIVYIVMLTTIIAMTVASALHIALNLRGIKNDIAEEVSLEAKVLGFTSAAAVLFDDKETAIEILSSLKLRKNILRALIVRPDGSVFASYELDTHTISVPQEWIDLDAGEFTDNHFLVSSPITIGGETLGAVIIESTLGKLYEETQHLLRATLIILFVVPIFALLFAIRLQKFITDPIFRLADAAKQVSLNDYSVRVEKTVEDELGILTDAFNLMISKVESQTIMLKEELAGRIMVEAEIQETKERLQSILDNTTSVISMKDNQGRYILTNKQHQKLFKISTTEVIGKTDYDIFPKETAKTLIENDSKVLETNNVVEVEETAMQDDGLHTYISVKFPLRDAAGQIYAICGISTDITEMKKSRIALEQFSRKLVETDENEKKRVASELHDSLGQNLLVINNEIRRHTQFLPTEISQSDDWTQLLLMANDSIKEIRRIAYGLRPPQLDQLGLGGAIKALTIKMSHTSGINISSDVNLGKQQLSPAMEINIYRIIQEAINNIMKHSHSTGASITLSTAHDKILLEITDDGSGFDYVSEDLGDYAAGGFGLHGMKERAKLLFGTFEVKSAVGKGTTLMFAFPIDETNNKE